LGQQPLGVILHSSNEPGELSQWLCRGDSTINIVLDIIIIIITIIIINYCGNNEQVVSKKSDLLDFKKLMCHLV